MTLEQKVLITSDQQKINDMISIGWVVKTIVAQHVSISTAVGYQQQIRGDFLILFEREKK